MRRERLLIPLFLLTPLVLASPAAAAEVTVDAVDYEFRSASQSIGVGDSVIWNFVTAGHTSSSVAGQAERWDSGTADAGTTFRRTFNRPGRYQYICIPHQTFEPPMRGVVTVGTDTVAKSVSRFKAKRTGNRVKVSFRLGEAAKVTYALKGPSKKTVKRGRLGTGARSFTVKGLKPGRYRGTLTAVDDFDKKTTAKSSFRVR